jgi:DNA-binding NtrC family response regulator
MTKILIIEGESFEGADLRRRLAAEGRSVLEAPSVAGGLALVVECRPDAVVLDLGPADVPGIDAFGRIQQLAPGTPVIFVAGPDKGAHAIEAMVAGAFDFLVSPLDIRALTSSLSRAVESPRIAPGASAPTDGGTAPSPGPMLGRCPAMQGVFKAIGRVAGQDVTVLILGESGTGKELVARAIYAHGRRSGGPFLPVNCAALSESLLESELFGHERGAFTGADRRRAGKFEQCHGGTMFLDEVGDMSLQSQAKVLRVLQDQRFERVGGSETVQADVRLIAATNRDLKGMISAGQFRGDLYYRLSVFTIQLPPLRERVEDIPYIADHLVGRYCREMGLGPREISPATIGALEAYSWPGNLRELQSVVKQMILRSSGPILEPEHLPESLEDPGPHVVDLPPGWDDFLDDRMRQGSRNLYAESLEFVERRLIARVLRQTGGNQVQASRILGINRGSLRQKIRSLGLAIGSVVLDADDAPSVVGDGGREAWAAPGATPDRHWGTRRPAGVSEVRR